MLTRIHVNQHRIKANRRRMFDPAFNTERFGADLEPVVTCKTYKSNTYAFEVEIDGPSRVVYRPEKPLECGAVLWIETENEVRVIR